MKIIVKLILAASVMPVFGNLSASTECHNPRHNHNHSVNCHKHFNSGHCHRPHVGFSLNIGAPVYASPVRVVERTYVPAPRPVTKVVKTYSTPTCQTTTYSSYGYYPYGVCQTQTVYSPAVYETYEIAQPVYVQPAVSVYEVEYRRQHPVSAAFNFAGAMIDAFAN